MVERGDHGGGKRDLGEGGWGKWTEEIGAEVRKEKSEMKKSKNMKSKRGERK